MFQILIKKGSLLGLSRKESGKEGVKVVGK